MKTIFNTVSLSFFLSALLSIPAFAQVSCRNIHFTAKQAALNSFEPRSLSKRISARFLMAANSELNSTTGNRVERKFTSSYKQVDENLQKMESQLGKYFDNFKLQARDHKTEGFLNITYTKYLTKLSLMHKGKPLVAKIRLRKYGLSPEADIIGREKFKPIEIMFDSNGKSISWLEFKIEHPDYENAVLKPRIKFRDDFASLLENPDRFLRQLSKIRSETKRLNTETKADGRIIQKDQLVDDMLTALVETMRGGVVLRPISETLYERTSYSINLPNNQTGEVVNVQLTLDRDIHQYSVALGKEIQSYNPQHDLSVLEVKVPVQYASFTKMDLESVTGLQSVFELIDGMKDVQTPGYKLDKGKFSRGVQVLEQELND